MADMLNHAECGAFNVNWKCEGDYYVERTNRDIAKGQALTHSYG